MRLPLPKLNNLYGRIFAIFWFTMLLVLFAVLTLPHLDPRNRVTYHRTHQRCSRAEIALNSNFATKPT